uniref:Uncharacterized protein n=1 Tax=Arundo donax TaxID=35708 RepID=A0A0A8ZK91_ARUDO
MSSISSSESCNSASSCCSKPSGQPLPRAVSKDKPKDAGQMSESTTSMRKPEPRGSGLEQGKLCGSWTCTGGNRRRGAAEASDGRTESARQRNMSPGICRGG